jgi:hypothetical protein
MEAKKILIIAGEVFCQAREIISVHKSKSSLVASLASEGKVS